MELFQENEAMIFAQKEQLMGKMELWHTIVHCRELEKQPKYEI